MVSSKDLGNSTIAITVITIITIAVIIFIRIIIIIITTVIIIRGTIIEINILIILGIFFIVKGKFAKLFKLFIKIVVNKLITLINDSATEGISNFYFEIIGLYIFIKFVLIEESSKFILKIELFYIFNYFKVLYFIASFYSEVNTVIFSI